ncbi:hypothetical protein SALBM217S_05847 [Streptomyces griseoloalbus]
MAQMYTSASVGSPSAGAAGVAWAVAVSPPKARAAAVSRVR